MMLLVRPARNDSRGSVQRDRAGSLSSTEGAADNRDRDALLARGWGNTRDSWSLGENSTSAE